MKTVIKVLPWLVGLICLTSCVSNNGRFCLLRLDKRTPAQLEAAKVRDTIVYTEALSTNKTAIATETTVAFPWSILVDLVKVIDGELDILSIEWKTKGEK